MATRTARIATAAPTLPVLAALLLGVAGTVRYLTLGDPAVSVHLFAFFSVGATVAVGFGVSRYGPVPRAPWLWLCAGLALWAIGDATWGWVLQTRRFPSYADIAYLLGYLCFGIALLGLVQRPGTFSVGRILDTVIAGLGYGFVLWSVSLGAGSRTGTGLLWVSGLYPAFDIAIVTGLVPLALHHRRAPSAWLLVAGFVLFLVSDSHYGASVIGGTYMAGTPGDAGWILGYVALALAALHPSMASLQPPPEAQDPRRLWRVVLLGTAVLLPPLTAGAAHALGRSPDLAITLSVSTIMSLLVVARLGATLGELLRREDRFRAFMQFPGLAAMIKDGTGRYVWMNDRAAASNGFGSIDWRGRSDAELLSPGRSAPFAAADAEVRRTGRPVEVEQRIDGPDGPRWWRIERFAIPGTPGFIGIVSLDITERIAAEAQATRLAAAVEQSHDAIVITRADGRIEYVNPAFEQMTGYTRDEVLGQNPRILKSGHQSEAFYRAMWATLVAGQPWVAEFVNRARNGAYFLDTESISPIRDDEGAISHYVAVHHDVTRERELETREARLQRERALIADTLRRLPVQSSPEETAEGICTQVVTLADTVSADLLLFGLNGRATSLAMVMAEGDSPGRRTLPRRRTGVLRERAAAGPWVEAWTDRPWHPYNGAFRDHGVRGTAYAPVHAAGELIGLLAVTSAADDAVARLTTYLPSLAEFAEVAGAVLGPAVAERTELSRVRSSIRRVIAQGAFHPVFQPIVDHVRGTVVGYEALTRFDNGARPDTRFAEAAAAGMGLDLEEATLRRALTEAERLPRSAFLNINVSPEFARERRIPESSGPHRYLVVEITEHAVIDDYAQVRGAVARFGPRRMLAVDDAGAGFASLHHVVELRPQFVKLDRSLIADIDADPGRQALVIGMLNFARQVGCRLIAEGVETPGELGFLRKAGVRLAQGFLLGRPEAAPADQPPPSPPTTRLRPDLPRGR